MGVVTTPPSPCVLKMADNNYRIPFVRKRSPPPPWLRDWDHGGNGRGYGNKRGRPDRGGSHEVYSSRDSYGPWTSGARDYRGRGDWEREDWEREDWEREDRRRDLPRDPRVVVRERGYGNDRHGNMGPIEEPKVVLGNNVRKVMTQLVDLVNSQPPRLPFNQDQRAVGGGEFSNDNLSADDQFTRVTSRAIQLKEERRGRCLYCNLCDLAVENIDQYQDHLMGMKHNKMLKKKGWEDELGTPSQARINTGLVPVDTNVKTMRCAVCEDKCQSDCLGPHIATQNHISAENKWRLLGKHIPRFVDMFVECDNSEEVVATPVNTGTPFCSICDVTLSSFEGLDTHNKGRKHSKNVQQLHQDSKEDLFCKVCNIRTTSKLGMKEHYNGKKHALKVLEMTVDTASNTAATTSNDSNSSSVCDVCNSVFCSDEELKEHYKKDEHFANIKRKVLESVRPPNPPIITPPAATAFQQYAIASQLYQQQANPYYYLAQTGYPYYYQPPQ